MSEVIGVLGLRAVRDARTRTAAFASIFALYAYVQVVGFRSAYPTIAGRLQFARSFATNKALVLFYGKAYDLLSVGGYAAWRVGGILAVAAAAFGMLSSVRALRAEEDAGRTELVLAGATTRTTVALAALAGVGACAAVVWVAEAAGLVAGGLAAGQSAYLALATASITIVFVAVGALVSQLAPTRRLAIELGGATIVAALVLRVLADTVTGAGWLRWLTPLGWAEELRPFTGDRPLVMLLPLASGAALLAAALALARGRDVGTGMLPAREQADPHLELLGSPLGLALRLERSSLAVWAAGIGSGAAIIGALAKSTRTAGISSALQRELERYGSGPVSTPRGYLGLVFIIFFLVVSLFGVSQVAAMRREEAEQRLETILAHPLSRRAWLAGRLAIASAAAAALGLIAALVCLAAVTASGAAVPFGGLLAAGANCVAMATLFIGIAALLFATLPRAGTGIAYGLVAVAFLWQLVGPLLDAPHWVVELTPFAHLGSAPGAPFRAPAALVLVGIGALSAVAATARFERRDVVFGA